MAARLRTRTRTRRRRVSSRRPAAPPRLALDADGFSTRPRADAHAFLCQLGCQRLNRASRHDDAAFGLEHRRANVVCIDMRVAGAQRCPVEQLEREVTAFERRARVGCVRVALGSQPQHAAWMPQAEARAVARVELAPLLARPPGESRVDLVGAVSVAENPRFVSRTRSRVCPARTHRQASRGRRRSTDGGPSTPQTRRPQSQRRRAWKI